MEADEVTPHDPHRHHLAAFDAVAATLPLGSVAYEAQLDAQGQRFIWLEARVIDKLTALRGPWRELQRRDFAAGRDRGEEMPLSLALSIH
jgi:hypothetical protein